MPEDLLTCARTYAASIADKSGQYTAATYLAQLVTRCERAEEQVERQRIDTYQATVRELEAERDALRGAVEAVREWAKENSAGGLLALIDGALAAGLRVTR